MMRETAMVYSLLHLLPPSHQFGVLRIRDQAGAYEAASRSGSRGEAQFWKQHGRPRSCIL